MIRALTRLATNSTVLAGAAVPARASRPIYPLGSTSLVPRPGMVPSKSFPTFEDPDKDAAKCILRTLPPRRSLQMENPSTTRR